MLEFAELQISHAHKHACADARPENGTRSRSQRREDPTMGGFDLRIRESGTMRRADVFI